MATRLLAKHEAATVAPLKLSLVVLREMLERASHLVIGQIPREAPTSLDFRY
ncbi:MAG TPA: hypothetical protein VK192_03980 [Sphingomicrobium sp.]|nr:hypothetical protein [Sphingomicrobium sp.]HLO23677.1 hypothetical protein [Methyloceanibacter sp.]